MVTVEKFLRYAMILAGISSCLGIIAIPLQTNALGASKNGSVSVTVNSTITLEVVVTAKGSGNTMALEVSPNTMDTGTFEARVKTNRPYILQLNGKDSTDLNYDDPLADYSIPGTGCVVAAGTSCWGVKLSTEADFSASSVISATPKTVYPQTNLVTYPAEVIVFNVGVSAGPSLVAGNYSGALVVTASNNS